MPTQNERTVPSPERDEELEKFIQKRFDLNCVDVPDDDWNHYMVREEDFKRAAIDIAAFSARRAHEKAIEECKIYLNDLSNKAQKENDPDTSFCYLTAFIALEKLKSPTN